MEFNKIIMNKWISIIWLALKIALLIILILGSQKVLVLYQNF